MADAARLSAAVAMATMAAMATMKPTAAEEPPLDAETPEDMAFIEYLGSWEEDDSDWVALAGTAAEQSPRRRPVAEREQDEENGTDEDTD